MVIRAWSSGFGVIEELEVILVGRFVHAEGCLQVCLQQTHVKQSIAFLLAFLHDGEQLGHLFLFLGSGFDALAVILDQKFSVGFQGFIRTFCLPGKTQNGSCAIQIAHCGQRLPKNRCQIRIGSVVFLERGDRGPGFIDITVGQVSLS